ncbi:MAG: hypothetical protein U0002_20075, partial [Thermoanaerobaculia bacterium]
MSGRVRFAAGMLSLLLTAPAWAAEEPKESFEPLSVYDERVAPEPDFAERGGSCAPGFAWGTSEASGIALRAASNQGVSSVNDLAFFDDGSGMALYAAGQFHTASGAWSYHVARFDGASWKPLGTGFSSGVASLAVYDDGNGARLYAAGGFASSSTGYGLDGIARWNGTDWERVGLGFNAAVADLAVVDFGSGPELVAAGSFTRADYGTGWHGQAIWTPVTGFARWDGERWQPVPIVLPGVESPYFLAALPEGGRQVLVIGSDRGVYRFEGSTLTQLLAVPAGSAPSGLVVADDGGGLGVFTGIGNELRRYRAGSWTVLGHFDQPVKALSVVGWAGPGPVYASGAFSNVDGLAVSALAAWTGGGWVAAGAGLAQPPTVLAYLDDGSGAALTTLARRLGEPALASAELALHRWAAGQWQALPEAGLDGEVTALAWLDGSRGPELYLGGFFQRTPDGAASYAARLSATGFAPLGAGPPGPVLALAVFDSGHGPELYAGGSRANGSGAYLARWDGSAWQDLGLVRSGAVRALAVWNDGSAPALYAGGTGFVDRFDGAGFTPLAPGMTGTVYALAPATVSGVSSLVAGGSFGSIGGVTASNVARFAAGSWSALGVGFNAPVYALVEGGTSPQLFAGGAFTRSGSTVALHVARLSAGSWLAVGPGLGLDQLSFYPEEEAVESLAFFDPYGGSSPQLYATGSFGGSSSTTAFDESSPRRIASFDGASWAPLGKGLDAQGWALLSVTSTDPPRLYVGGRFTAAGLSPSRFLAVYDRALSCQAQAITVTTPGDGFLTRAGSISVEGLLALPALLSIQGRPTPLSPELSFATVVPLAEGSQVVRIAARGPGNTTLETQVSGRRDSQAPALAWVSPPAGASLTSARPRLELAVTETGSGLALESVRLKLAGSTLAASCTVSGTSLACQPLADLPSGLVSLSVAAQDRAGNAAESATRSFTVAPSAGTTTLVGGVRLPGGAAAAGAKVSVLGPSGATGTAAADGSFSFAGLGVPTLSPLTVLAQTKPASSGFLSGTATVAPVPGGLTDAGVIQLGLGCPLGFGPALTSGLGASGAGARVLSLAVFDDGTGAALYAGGDFTAIAGVPARYLARFDGTTWHEAAGGANAPVRALTVWDDGRGPALYAGGDFTQVGGATAASRLARFDGAQWSPLGTGVSAPVYALLGWNGSLYAGGSFTQAGGAAAARIARFDGTGWSALGSGIAASALGATTTVFALSLYDDGTGPALYAGGTFDLAGGATARGVARWNGSAWAPLGYGVGSSSGGGGIVSALAVYRGELYAAGQFSSAGASGVDHAIARWNGRRWLSADAGLEASGAAVPGPQGVQALTVWDDGHGARLYAAGEITAASGLVVSHLVSFDGSRWQG